MSETSDFGKALENARYRATADTWDPVDGIRYGLVDLCDAVEALGQRILELERLAGLLR